MPTLYPRPYGPPLDETALALAIAKHHQRVTPIDAVYPMQPVAQVGPLTAHLRVGSIDRTLAPADYKAPSDAFPGEYIYRPGFYQDFPPDHRFLGEVVAYSDDFRPDASWNDDVMRVDDATFLTIDRQSAPILTGDDGHGNPLIQETNNGNMIMNLFRWDGLGDVDHPGHIDRVQRVDLGWWATGMFFNCLGDGEHFALYQSMYTSPTDPLHDTLNFRTFRVDGDEIVWLSDWTRWVPIPGTTMGANGQSLVWLDDNTLVYFAYSSTRIVAHTYDVKGRSLRIDSVVNPANDGALSFITAARGPNGVYITWDTGIASGFSNTFPTPWQVEWTRSAGFGPVQMVDPTTGGILERPFSSSGSILFYGGRSTERKASARAPGGGYADVFGTLWVDTVSHLWGQGFIAYEQLNFVGEDTIYPVRTPVFTVAAAITATDTGIVLAYSNNRRLVDDDGVIGVIDDTEMFNDYPNNFADWFFILNEQCLVSYGQLFERLYQAHPPFEFRVWIQSWQTARDVADTAKSDQRVRPYTKEPV